MAEKQVSVKLTDDIIQSLDKYAVIFGKTRHDLIKAILKMGVDEIKDLKLVGIFELGMKLRDLHHSIKDKLGITSTYTKDDKGKPIPVKLSDEFIFELDKLAERAGISRHQLMQNFIKVGLQDADFFEKTGVLKAVISIRDMSKGFKKICDLGMKAFSATDKKQKGGD
jgi:predicted DNA-binding protein